MQRKSIYKGAVMNPMQSPNVGVGGKDFGGKAKSEFIPFGSLERVVMICVNKGITQPLHIENYLIKTFDSGDISLKPSKKQISDALQRLKKSGDVERRHGMWRPTRLDA